MGKDVLYQVPVFHLVALTQIPIRGITFPSITVRMTVSLDGPRDHSLSCSSIFVDYKTPSPCTQGVEDRLG